MSENFSYKNVIKNLFKTLEKYFKVGFGFKFVVKSCYNKKSSVFLDK